MVSPERALYIRKMLNSEKLVFMKNQIDTDHYDFVRVGISPRESFGNSHTGRFVGRLRRIMSPTK